MNKRSTKTREKIITKASQLSHRHAAPAAPQSPLFSKPKTAPRAPFGFGFNPPTPTRRQNSDARRLEESSPTRQRHLNDKSQTESQEGQAILPVAKSPRRQLTREEIDRLNQLKADKSTYLRIDNTPMPQGALMPRRENVKRVRKPGEPKKNGAPWPNAKPVTLINQAHDRPPMRIAPEQTRRHQPILGGRLKPMALSKGTPSRLEGGYHQPLQLSRPSSRGVMHTMESQRSDRIVTRYQSSNQSRQGDTRSLNRSQSFHYQAEDLGFCQKPDEEMCLSDLNQPSLLQSKPTRLAKKGTPVRSQWDLPPTQGSGHSRQTRSAQKEPHGGYALQQAISSGFKNQEEKPATDRSTQGHPFRPEQFSGIGEDKEEGKLLYSTLIMQLNKKEEQSHDPAQFHQPKVYPARHYQSSTVSDFYSQQPYQLMKKAENHYQPLPSRGRPPTRVLGKRQQPKSHHRLDDTEYISDNTTQQQDKVYQQQYARYTSRPYVKSPRSGVSQQDHRYFEANLSPSEDMRPNLNGSLLQRVPARPMSEMEEGTMDDFWKSYQSDQDEDYSEQEDLIQNKRQYKQDHHPFSKSIPKTEVESLLKDQGRLTPKKSPPSPQRDFLEADHYRPFDPTFEMSMQSLGMLKEKKPSASKDRAEPPITQSLFDNQTYSRFLQQSTNKFNQLILHEDDEIDLDHDSKMSGLGSIPHTLRDRTRLKTNKEEPDIQVDPIITRNRQHQLDSYLHQHLEDEFQNSTSLLNYHRYKEEQRQQIAYDHSSFGRRASSKHGEHSEKTFSFKDSLREASKQSRRNERRREDFERHDLHREDSQEQAHRADQRKTDKEGQSNFHQNNYFYNFNGNVPIQQILSRPQGSSSAEGDQMQRLPSSDETSEVLKKLEDIQQELKKSKIAQASQSQETRKPIIEAKRNEEGGERSKSETLMDRLHSLIIQQLQPKKKENPMERKTKEQTNSEDEESSIREKFTVKQLAEIGKVHVMLMRQLEMEKNLSSAAPTQELLKPKKTKHRVTFKEESPSPAKELIEPEEPSEKVSPVVSPPPEKVAKPLKKKNISNQDRIEAAIQMEQKYESFQDFYFQFYNKEYFGWQLTNAQLKQLILHTQLYVQLLIQVLLFKPREGRDAEPLKNKMQNRKIRDDSPLESKKVINGSIKDNQKYKAYTFLYQFIQEKEKALSIFKKTHGLEKLQKYQIPWVSQWEHFANSILYKKSPEEVEVPSKFEVHPQFSYFQVHLLEFAPMVIDAFLNPYPMKLTSKPEYLFLVMRPLLNKAFLPISGATDSQSEIPRKTKVPQHLIDPFDIFVEQCQGKSALTDVVEQPIIFPVKGNRRKFSEVDDNYLLYALRLCGNARNHEWIEENWLPRKNPTEIHHRIKNLTCGRAANNLIKKWKQEHNQPLRQGMQLPPTDTEGAKVNIEEVKPQMYVELERLAQIIKWFGIGDHRTIISDLQTHPEVFKAANFKDQTDEHLPVKFLGKSQQEKMASNDCQHVEQTLMMSKFSRWDQASSFYLPFKTGDFLMLELNNILQQPAKVKQLGQLLMKKLPWEEDTEQKAGSEQQKPASKVEVVETLDWDEL